MKMVMIANVIIKVAFMVCITILSLKFESVKVLWWFLLTPFLGFEYSNGKVS